MVYVIARVAALVLIGALGLVAIVSGVSGIIRGPGDAGTTAAVQSNFRFLSAFLLAGGLILAWTLFRFDVATVPLRIVCATVLVGGLARLLAIPSAGAPDAAYTAYIVAELVLPFAIVGLHAFVTSNPTR